MIDKKWKWVAKDESGRVYVFSDRPTKGVTSWCSVGENNSTYTVANRLFNLDLPWYDSLHEIIHHEDGKIEFRKARPELKVDDPVWVRDNDTSEWCRRHFAKWNDRGRIMVWPYGHTAFTAQDDEEAPISYLQYKLP